MPSIPASTSSASACSPNTCAVTRQPSSWARVIAAPATSAGHSGAQVADVAVDPVPDQLHPAVAAGGLPLHLGDQLIGSTSSP